MTSYMTMSFAKGKKSETSISHNNRSLDPNFDFSKAGHKHIKQEYTHLNQVWVHQSIRDVYQKEFGAAVDEYNQKQKRKDRKIGNYYDKVKANKNMRTQYEFVVQVGNKDDWSKWSDDRDNPKGAWQFAGRMLHEYYLGFQKRNPNLVVYNCALHMDEQGSPHIHMNVVPVGRNYQRGVNVRPSLKKALMQEGIEFDRHDSRLMWRNFQNREQEALADIAKRYHIERVAGVTNKLRDVHQYKEAMRLVDEAEDKERAAQARAQQAEQQAATQEEKSTDLRKSFTELRKKSMEERKKLDQITAESTQKRKKLDQVNADLFDKQDQLALIKKQVAAQQALLNSVDEKKKQDKELTDKIEKKKQRLDKLDRDYEAKTDGWQQYQQTVEKITTMHKRLRKPEDYIVYTKTPLGREKFDEELTQGNITQLINAASKGALIDDVMAENKSLTVEQSKKIQEAVDKAVAPYKKTIASQKKELARKDSLIAELKDYVQLTMDSAREFVKKKVPEVYQEFVRGIGARIRVRGIKHIFSMDKSDKMEAKQGFNNPRQYDETYDKAYQNNLLRQSQERGLE